MKGDSGKAGAKVTIFLTHNLKIYAFRFHYEIPISHMPIVLTPRYRIGLSF